MEKERAYGDWDCLVGYTEEGEVLVDNTVEQIVAFIMHYAYVCDTELRTPLEDLVLTTIFGGFIMKCPNQEFLITRIHPNLIPVQTGQTESPVFVPVGANDEEEEVF